jgi:hypothetical protein
MPAAAIVFATRSGGRTLDRDECGGNPFATALIRLAGRDGMTLDRLPEALRRHTQRASGGLQNPEWNRRPGPRGWRFRLRAGSRDHDVGLVYCTGHGVERDGAVYLLPSDTPPRSGFGAGALRRRAIAVRRLASASRAARLNLVFFAGCRTLIGGVDGR